MAIARALVTKPTILFADEPTGNLDSKTGGEILELLRDSARDYGQTIVMVTHEARAASIADRILFLADGLIVKELTDTDAGTGARGDEHAAVVTRVALRGLLGRKLRARLTAFAIVLGVAMVSGTFVLTDTIKAAFSTVFTTVYQNTDAVITGKSAISRQQQRQRPDDAVAAGVAADQGASAAAGRRRRRAAISDNAQLVGRNGKVISSGGAPGLAFSYSPRRPALQPADADERPVPDWPG